MIVNKEEGEKKDEGKEEEADEEEKKRDKKKKQGRIHGNPVADCLAGAVMRKPLAIQKCYRRTDQRTNTARCRVACP